MTPPRARRSDVDGLRGLAVFAIVLYHARKEHLPGGFVGVDIFLAVSGFLITGIVCREMDGEEFSFARFYARRARRLAPALIVMLGFTCCAGSLLYPNGIRDHFVVGGLIASLLASSNFYLWLLTDQGNYFASAAEMNPLTHMWSLSLEEQFYFVWPVFLLLIYSQKKKGLLVLSLIGASIASAVAGELALGEVFCYYILPMRLAPLLLGASASLMHERVHGASWTRLQKESISLVALATLLGTLVFLSESHYPGWPSLLPSFSSAILLGAMEETLIVSRIFSFPLLHQLGLMSYSVYLYHWPFMAFLRNEGVSFGGVHLFTVLVYCLALGYVSYQLVELPTMERPITSPARTIVIMYILPALLLGLAAASMLFLAPIIAPGRVPLLKDVPPPASPGGSTRFHGLHLQENTRYHGVPSQLYAEYYKMATMESEPVSCFIRINSDHELPKVKQTLEEANKTLSCWVGPTQTRNASALLYGDSHAAAYAGQLQAFSEAVGGAFYYMGQNGCGAVGNPEENKAKSCALVRAAALEASESFDWVIIAQAWSHYNSFQDTFDGIKALVTKLVQSGKNVILLGEVPHTNTAGACPLMLTNVTTQDEKRRCLGEHHLRWWRERSWNMNSYLEGLSHAFPRVWYWDPNYYMCMDGVCSRYNSMGLLMYVDGTHRGWRRGMMDGQEIVRKWGVPECFVAAFRSKNGGKQTCFRVPNEPDDGGQAIGNDYFSRTGPCAPMQLRS